MLYETSSGRRRLFRSGDPCHPGRTTGKNVPAHDALPMEYRDLIDWYHGEYSVKNCEAEDPVLALRGLGKEIWANEDADDYVHRQRGGWQ